VGSALTSPRPEARLPRASSSAHPSPMAQPSGCPQRLPASTHCSLWIDSIMQLWRITAGAGNSHLLILLSIQVRGTPESGSAGCPTLHAARRGCLSLTKTLCALLRIHVPWPISATAVLLLYRKTW
jgi:hypothetical protein